MFNQVVEFLSRQRYGVISTIDATGAPESALVGIAWWRSADDCPELMFDTTSATRKAKNLDAEKRCCAVIGWEDETTVQLDGHGRRLEGAELQAAKLDYFRAWPECRAHESWPDVAYFSIRPQWLRYSCFLRGPTIAEFDRHQLIDGFRESASALFQPPEI